MLTPVDIENKEFAKAFRGYDSIEVDEFMRTLVADYEKLYRENGSLKEKNAIISETLENYKGMETTMQNAILVAQKTAEDIKQHAYERSGTITKEAEIKAGNIIAEAEKRASVLEEEYSSLKKEMNTFKARMNSLLQTYMKLLEDMPEGAKERAGEAMVSDLEKDINKIQKQNSERGDYQNIPLSKQATVEFKLDNEKKSDSLPEEKSDTKEVASTDEDTYAPKKVNPLVDELLKKRAEENGADDGEAEAPSKEDADANEIIIDLSKNNKPYDVFSDESL